MYISGFVGPIGTRIVALNPSFANFILFELISNRVKTKLVVKLGFCEVGVGGDKF